MLAAKGKNPVLKNCGIGQKLKKPDGRMKGRQDMSSGMRNRQAVCGSTFCRVCGTEGGNGDRKSRDTEILEGISEEVSDGMPRLRHPVLLCASVGGWDWNFVKMFQSRTDIASTDSWVFCDKWKLLFGFGKGRDMV